MKRVCFLFLALLLFFNFGCSDNKPESDVGGPVPPVPEPDGISLQSNLPTATEEGGTVTVEFITNQHWSVSATEARSASWFSISPQSGEAGKVEIDITFEAHEGYADRGIDVIITAGTAREAFNLVQKKKGALILTPETEPVPEEGGIIEVLVKTNLVYEVVIPADYREWITPETTGPRSLTEYTERFVIAANTTEEKRKGEIVIRDTESNLADTVTIYQIGEKEVILPEGPFLQSDGNIYLDHNSEIIEVVVWSTAIPDESVYSYSWIQQEKVLHEATISRYYFRVNANDTGENRYAGLTFYNIDPQESETVLISQFHEDAVLLGLPTQQIGLDGGDFTLTVRDDMEAELVIPDEVAGWITLSNGKDSNARALGVKEFHLTVAPSTQGKRQCEIYLKTKSDMETILIFQAPIGDLILSEDHFEIGANGGTLDFYMVGEPYGHDLPDWIWLIDLRRFGLIYRLTLQVFPSGMEGRRVEANIENKEGKTGKITIVQSAEDNINVSNKKEYLPMLGGTIDVNLKSNIDFTVKVSDDWIKELPKARDMMEYSYRYQVDRNDGNNQRKGYIAFNNLNNQVSDTVWVYQEGWDSRQGDSLALAAFYREMKGNEWQFTYRDASGNYHSGGKWRLDRPLEEWNGIILEQGRLTKIHLFDVSNLVGNVPAEFCNAKRLTDLTIHGAYQQCCITSLPEEFCNLENLQYLELYCCAIYDNYDIQQGISSLPSTMDQMHNLLWLQLHTSCTFTEIPSVIFRMHNLSKLNLYQVRFSGTIPEEIGYMRGLNDLTLYGFHTAMVGPVGFTGNLPESLRNLNLTGLDLGGNNFEGSLPDWIGEFPNLYTLNLFTAGFSGELPESVNTLTNLRNINLAGNRFTGIIPPGLRGSPYFDEWYVNGMFNQFMGYGFTNPYLK